MQLLKESRMEIKLKTEVNNKVQLEATGIAKDIDKLKFILENRDKH